MPPLPWSDDQPYWAQVLGPLLLQGLAERPVEGVNVHAPPQMVGQPQYAGMMAPEAYAAGGGGPAANAEAVPFGSFADPVSQLAFLLAPGLQRGLGTVAEGMTTPGPRLAAFASERGNLGRPPLGWRGGKEVPLPESVVRDPQGHLVKVYHGTRTTFPDFDVQYADPTALYGKGIYTTAHPAVASRYA